MAAYRLERWERAESAFLRATELHPERAASWLFRGIALWNLERYGEAVGPLEGAVELEPERSLAYYYLAICYSETDDSFEKVSRSRPPSRQVLVGPSRLAETTGAES